MGKTNDRRTIGSCATVAVGLTSHNASSKTGAIGGIRSRYLIIRRFLIGSVALAVRTLLEFERIEDVARSIQRSVQQPRSVHMHMLVYVPLVDAFGGMRFRCAVLILIARAY